MSWEQLCFISDLQWLEDEAPCCTAQHTCTSFCCMYAVQKASGALVAEYLFRLCVQYIWAWLS